MKATQDRLAGEEDAPLPGVLAEFRIALREEMETAKKGSAATAVPLIDGRRTAQVGARFHYLFTMESALNLAGDTPGDLLLHNRSPVEVEVVEIKGMHIILSSSVDLGPHIPKARFYTDLSQLMRRLIERIESMSRRENKAGLRILEGGPVSGSLLRFESARLNPEQRKAVSSALGRDTTFLWGPPGTGKTHTIGTIGCELYRSRRSVLVVSHTNTAVDGALLKIAEALNEDFEPGKVLRVGNPVDARLKERPELLLETHVRRRERELGELLSSLEVRLTESKRRSIEAQRDLAIVEWIAEAETDLASMTRQLEEVLSLRTEAEFWKRKLSELDQKEQLWNGIARMARASLEHASRAKQVEDSLVKIRGEMSCLSERINDLQTCLTGEKQILGQSERLAPVRARARALPAQVRQRILLEQIEGKLAQASAECEEYSAKLAEAEHAYAETTAVNVLTRLWRGLPDPVAQERLVTHIKEILDSARSKRQHVQRQRDAAASSLEEIIALDTQLTRFAQVPEQEQQRQQVDWLCKKISNLREELGALETAEEHAEQELNKANELTAWFERNYRGTPESLLQQSEAYRRDLEEARGESSRLERAYGARFAQIRDLLRVRLEALRRFGLLQGSIPATADRMLAMIRDAFQEAVRSCEGVRRDDLLVEIAKVNEEIREIETEVLRIQDDLKRVEELIIRDAVVIATTLTRAYLRDSIQNRRFDTVILDEASMAPIPALWVAAGLAEAAIVVVGDFLQLPPIVLSKHELAQKWLGRDVFEVAGITKAVESKRDPEPLVQLRLQHRMHPKISGIVNPLIYWGRLSDAPSMDLEGEGELRGWYRTDWGYDTSVLLVDTGSLGAWVTSVPRGGHASRLNLLSAALCTELASRLLREDRLSLSPEEPPRILICSPYRPHASMVGLLVAEQGLKSDVLAGTAHTFQGKEADVVILDLVNDDPHWRVGLFNPDRDESTKRLLNVAITRARRRLIVVGDFDYIRSKAKRAFLGHRLIPRLEDQFKRVDATELLKSFQNGEFVESGRLCASEELAQALSSDLDTAEEIAVFYSPNLSGPTLEDMAAAINAARERLLRIYVITRPQCQRGRREGGRYASMEKVLRDWGVRVIHKLHMREKLVVLDDKIAWLCSLDPLAYSEEAGFAVRWESQRFSKECLNVLRTSRLIKAYDDEELLCPICSDEIVAAEGTEEPFYWRCIQEDCYTRNIDQPFLRGGIVVCGKCSGAVEFGEWGGEPHWRCIENRHHRQRIVKSHLKLPDMRALIPKRELRRLDRSYGLT